MACHRWDATAKVKRLAKRQAVDAMMAPSVRHPGRETPSASDRQSDRFTDPIHGLEHVRSGPVISPVEPVALLDPKGGGCAVSGHGRACEVDGVVSAGRARGGGERGPHSDDRGARIWGAPGTVITEGDGVAGLAR